MENEFFYYYGLFAIQLFLCVRYVVKASYGHIQDYKFYKLLIVAFVPIVGYFIATEKKVEVS